jgi:hypothetical protein
MSVLEAKARYALILGDIAIAAAIAAHDAGFRFDTGEVYVPGAIRERWLAGAAGAGIKTRVAGMATAAASSLQSMSGSQLMAAAAKYAIALDAATAQGMADYFEAKRNAVLTYNK